MKDHKDKTAEIAVGRADREWKSMINLAIKIREGRCNPSLAYDQESKFIGIYKRLLTDPIDELKREVRG